MPRIVTGHQVSTMTAAAVVTGPAMIKVLYNDCYGVFNLSVEFVAEYERRTGKKVEEHRYLGTGSESIRIDPVAIAIFEERGSEWCSGRASSLEILKIPATFARYWEIEEYDGNEHIVVNVEGALADVLETYIQTGDHATMLYQYRHIKTAQQQLWQGFRKD